MDWCKEIIIIIQIIEYDVDYNVTHHIIMSVIEVL